jgi:hypothetical protein
MFTVQDLRVALPAEMHQLIEPWLRSPVLQALVAHKIKEAQQVMLCLDVEDTSFSAVYSAYQNMLSTWQLLSREIAQAVANQPVLPHVYHHPV